MIKDQFGIIQNLQTSPIPQTSFLPWTFFCRFLQQDCSKYASTDSIRSDQSRQPTEQLSKPSMIYKKILKEL